MADNYTVKDGNGTLIDISAKDEGSGVFATRSYPQVAGADISNGNPMPITVTDAELASIDSKIPALGQAAMAASTPVVIANNQSAISVNLTASSAGFLPTDSTKLASIESKTPALGQAAMAASVPVTLASNQPTIPVSVSGVATAAKQPALGTAGTASADVITVQGITGGTPLPVVISSATTVSVLTYDMHTDGSGNVKQNVKSTAGSLEGYVAHNSGASTIYVKFMNSNTSPANAHKLIVPLAPGATANISFSKAVPFSTGIGYSVEQGYAPNSTAAVATTCTLTVIYS